MEDDEVLAYVPGAMGSYQAGMAGNGPLEPTMAGAQQMAEQSAIRRRAEVSAPSAPSTAQSLSQPFEGTTRRSQPYMFATNGGAQAQLQPGESPQQMAQRLAAQRLADVQARASGNAGPQPGMGPTAPPSSAQTRRQAMAYQDTGPFEVISAADRARATTPAMARQQVNDALADEIRRGLQNGVVTASGRAITPGNVQGAVNSAGDMSAVNAAMREALAIRQGAIDARNRAEAGPAMSVQDQIARAIARAPQQEVPQGERGWGVSVRAQNNIRDNNAQARRDAVNAVLGVNKSQADLAGAQAGAQAQLQRAQLDNQTTLQRQALANQGALAVAQERGGFDPRQSLLDGYVEAMLAGDQEAAARMLDMSSALQQVMDEDAGVRGYANGGVVQGAQGLATPDAGNARQTIDKYRQYVLAARQSGAPVVSFQQFSNLGTGTPGAAMAFAEGGQVPDPSDVSGKMVVDTNPAAPTDSIPAVVDGTAPAKLDSGEFVIPKDVVMFFGTDKLNKMIAAARKPQGEPAAQ